ncbi:MAG: Beta-barrel assembly-enhancing protease [bacterium]|nr:Beta-barrel assembly-enhancing protease [bacterium]
MRLLLAFPWAMALILGAATHAADGPERARAWEGTLTIPTYPLGPEDINPRFEQMDDAIIYPYPMQDYLSPDKSDQDHGALFLENEYLKVTCLPDLGGRIHSVLDKTTGREMFDTNEVIKPGLIAMRGAWISGGVEWNTGPHGHTVTAVSPVDALAREDGDGSASLFISNTEKIFRTRWTVRVTLYPGKAYLHERIRIDNPTDGVHPYYFWNCTAFPCLPGTRFIFPMTLGTDHDGKAFFHWPIHEGVDLTWLKNYDKPSSIFAYECTQDFFGAYDVDLDQGVVQYADHRALRGKKAWTWGQSEDGRMSQRALTDDGSEYIEVQSGPLLTQSDYGLLEPHEGVGWEEWWYPVHGLGDGFEFATRDLAVQTAREEGSKKLRLSLLATSEFPSAQIETRPMGSPDAVGGTDVRLADLSPRKPVHLDLAAGHPPPLQVEIKSREGSVLASFVTPLPIPKVEPPEETEKPREKAEPSAEEEYQSALVADQATKRVQARAGYERALSKDPTHAASLKALAVLDLEAGLYEAAEAGLRKALEVEPGDGAAWHFLGAALLKQGENEESLRCAEKAAELLPKSSRGSDLVGRLRMRSGQNGEAISAFRSALERNPEDDRAADHLLLALWLTGAREEPGTFARERIRQDPTTVIPHLVLFRLEGNEGDGWIEEVVTWAGEDAFTLTEAAHALVEAGLAEEGQAILKRFSPLEQPFPSRPEELEVFTRALADSPADATAQLRLGNLLAGLLRIEEAVPRWEEAARSDPSQSVAFRNLGLHAWKRESDLAKAEGYYRKAIRARLSDQVLYRDLGKILLEAERAPDAIALMESLPAGGVRRNDVIETLAKAYNTERRFEDTIRLLEGVSFSNWEGQKSSRELWATARIERGRGMLEAKRTEAALADFESALTYPENLGVGRPAEPEEAEALYWRGKALSELGRTSEARKAWELGAGGPSRAGKQDEYRDLCAKALVE